MENATRNSTVGKLLAIDMCISLSQKEKKGKRMRQIITDNRL